MKNIKLKIDTLDGWLKSLKHRKGKGIYWEREQKEPVEALVREGKMAKPNRNRKSR